MLPLHEYGNLSAAAGLADEAPVVIEVGEDFEEDFDRELENCSVQVRCESKQRRQEPECSLPLVWACGVRWIVTRVRRETAPVRLCLGGIVAVRGV